MVFQSRNEFEFSLKRIYGKRVPALALCNGVFDFFHFGHASFFRNVAERLYRLGRTTILAVAVNSDASVARIKPGRPINCLGARMMVLDVIQGVDYVFPFEEDTPLETVQLLGPQILIKGEDWKEVDIVGATEVKACGGEVWRIPLAEGVSTTEIIRRIKNGENAFTETSKTRS